MKANMEDGGSEMDTQTAATDPPYYDHRERPPPETVACGA